MNNPDQQSLLNVASATRATVQEVIREEEAARVRAPLESAALLPPRVYCDDGIFLREQTHVLRRNWLPMCHVSQLEESGSFVARNLAGEPVVALRDRNSAVQVFSNVCPHRSATLLEGSGTCHANRFACPYHGWTFGTDGSLLAAPHMGQAKDFDKADNSLLKIRHEIWEGFVFITFSPDVKSLAEMLATFTPKIAPYKMAGAKAVELGRKRLRYNWKFSMDNFTETYHPMFVHKDTTDDISTLIKTDYEDSDGPYSLFWMPSSNGGRVQTARPPIPDMPEGHYTNTSVFNIYPLFHVFTDPAMPMWLDWEIRGPRDHDQIWYAMLPPEDAYDAKTVETIRKQYEKFFLPILDEDEEICLRTAEGTASTLARQGRLSHLEKGVYQFHNWWLDQYGVE